MLLFYCICIYVLWTWYWFKTFYHHCIFIIAINICCIFQYSWYRSYSNRWFLEILWSICWIICYTLIGVLLYRKVWGLSIKFTFYQGRDNCLRICLLLNLLYCRILLLLTLFPLIDLLMSNWIQLWKAFAMLHCLRFALLALLNWRRRNYHWIWHLKCKARLILIGERLFWFSERVILIYLFNYIGIIVYSKRRLVSWKYLFDLLIILKRTLFMKGSSL